MNLESRPKIYPYHVQALQAAIDAALLFEGATAPNPPVGAAALDVNGKLLTARAHERAGTAHAEINLINECTRLGCIDRIADIVVTLEPCNHFGRTGPCTQALLKIPGLKRVLIGASDPNSRVIGGGAQYIGAHGIQVDFFRSQDSIKAQKLIEAFSHHSKTGLPWVTIKTAHQLGGSMIPAQGQKTFTSHESLVFAHRLRKSCDAILTGSGTMLADDPHFTVRHVTDHPGKKRSLVIMDRSKRTPQILLTQAEARGFDAWLDARPLCQVLKALGDQGVLRVLVEAGPALTQALIEQNLWNDHYRIELSVDGAERIIYRTLSNPEGSVL